MEKKFTNLTIDYKTLLSMPVGDKTAIISSEAGRSMLSFLTPSQLSDIFPRYYLQKYPDIGLSKATSERIPERGSAMPSSTMRPSWMRDVERQSGASQSPVVAWQRAVKEKSGIDLTVGEFSDTAALIRRKEGFRSTPYWDVNAWRIGYGSDTITNPDGSSVKVTQGMRITREDAERDLQRRIPEFQQQGIIQHVGQNAWEKLNDQTKAAITSLAYNYGSISRLDALKRAIASNDKTMIAQAVESYAKHNEGVNYSRRMEEAKMIRSSSDTPASSAEIPQLPQGLNPKLVSEVQRMSPNQQRNFHRALNKMGDNDTAVGVNKMNELYIQNPNNADRAASLGGNFIHPVDAEIGSRFGPRNRPTAGASQNHRGVDYRAGAGSSVRASADGVVTRAGLAGGYGNMVEIDHGNGIKTRYAHLRGFDVKPGDRVARGQSFAKSGGVPGEPGAGTTTGPHLHYEVLRDGRQVDPVEFYRDNNTYSEPSSAPTARPATTPVRQEAVSATPSAVETPRQQQSVPPATTERQEALSVTPGAGEAEKIPVNAKGGSMKVNDDEIKAMPIGGTKGDNSVVVDSKNKPLFTMNTKREEANYNPMTGKVSIQPVTKTDASQVGSEPVKTMEQPVMDQQQESIPQQAAMAAMQPNSQPSMDRKSSGETSLTLTENIFKDPGFHRAVARTRFQNTGDAALGGHFDWTASNV